MSRSRAPLPRADGGSIAKKRMPAWGPDGRRVVAPAKPAAAEANVDKTKNSLIDQRKISQADRLAADVLTANCPPWCFMVYVSTLHVGHYAACLVLGSARAVVAAALCVLLADASTHVVASLAPSALDAAAQKWTTLASSLASAPSAESDKRVQQLALLRAGLASWIARHTTAVDAAAHVRTHLAHVLLGLGSLSLAGLVNSESGLWWTTGGLLWAAISTLVARDRLPGLDRTSSKLYSTVADSAVVTWFSPAPTPDPDDDDGGDGDANFVVVNAVADTPGAGSDTAKGKGKVNVAKDRAKKAKTKKARAVPAGAAAGNGGSHAAASPPSPAALKTSHRVNAVFPAGSAGSERRRRSWSLLDDSNSSEVSAATSPVLASAMTTEPEPPPPPPPLLAGLMTSTPAPASGQDPKVNSRWAIGGADADVDNRPRGWSILQDDGRVAEPCMQKRGRGWSILYDDSPKQPAAATAAVAAGFWEVVPTSESNRTGHFAQRNQTKPDGVADAGLFDDDDETEWLGLGAGTDLSALRAKTGVDEDGARPRGWSMLHADDANPDHGSDREWSMLNDTNADDDGNGDSVPEEAEVPGVTLRSRRGQPGPSLVASRTRNAGGSGSYDGSEKRPSPLGATVPAAAGAGESFVIVAKQ